MDRVKRRAFGQRRICRGTCDNHRDPDLLFVAGFLYLGIGIYYNTKRTADAVEKMVRNEPAVRKEPTGRKDPVIRKEPTL